MTARATVAFSDDEVTQIGAERIVLICADALEDELGNLIIRRDKFSGAMLPPERVFNCLFTCRRQGKGYVLTAEALPVHNRKAA